MAVYIGQALLTYSESELKEILDLLRILADEKRLKIMALLTQGELCVCEIMSALGLPQTLVSHHLKVLRDAKLVRDRRVAQWIYYSINVERLAELNARYLALFDVSRISVPPGREGLPRPS